VTEENTHTDISSYRLDGSRQHPLPWILFGVSAIVLALVGGLLAKRVSLETRRANEEIERNAGLKAQIEQLQRMQAESDKRVADAEAKAKTAQDASIDAAANLKRSDAERDRLQKELDGKKGAATDPKDKKTTKGKKSSKKKKKSSSSDF
jgi:uncharacterized protein YlxW (UPF0749 family)